MLRSFNSSFQVLLRDGQTNQYTSATDPVTGEVTKIDVTLNVLKQGPSRRSRLSC